MGLERAQLSDLLGGDARMNAGITLAILNGERGPKRDATLLNAGAGLYAANASSSIADGVRSAADVIDSGEALEALNRLVAWTQSITREAAAV